jgi:hypothetical protein
VNGVVDADARVSEGAARADTFMDTSLLEQIRKSGFIDRLYRRSVEIGIENRG